MVNGEALALLSDPVAPRNVVPVSCQSQKNAGSFCSVQRAQTLSGAQTMSLHCGRCFFDCCAVFEHQRRHRNPRRIQGYTTTAAFPLMVTMRASLRRRLGRPGCTPLHVACFRGSRQSCCSPREPMKTRRLHMEPPQLIACQSSHAAVVNCCSRMEQTVTRQTTMERSRCSCMH